MTEHIWQEPPKIKRAETNEVHVWKNDLDLDSERISKFLNILSEQESRRTSRFYFDRHRVRYIAAHGLLRSILGEYLEDDPKSLVFCANEYGKPYLCSNRNNSRPLLFNLSHSFNLSVIAISPDLEVGIDVEYINRDVEIRELVSRFFSQKEIKDVDSMPEDMKRYAFFHLWTRMEAYIKGKGGGLAFHRDGSSSKDFAEWRLFDIKPSPEYIGALAVRGNPAAVKYFAGHL